MSISTAYRQTRTRRSVSTLALARAIAPLLVLAGCSGGGSNTPAPAPAPTPAPTSTPTPAPGNNAAPVFTSPVVASVTENSTAAYQATATDANDDPILFSIAGGPDAGQFTITQAGALTFKAAPKVSAPQDSNGDNIYQVQIGASDGKVNTTLDLQITVTPATAGFKVVQIATGFTQPTWVGPVPGSPGLVFVTEKTGKIYTLDTATGAKTLLFTVGNLSTDNERGVVGLAASPNYATSKEIFLHTTAGDGTVEIRQYKVGDAAFNGTGYRVVLGTPHPNSNHNGGWIGFGPNGYLYDAIGDGGTGGNPSQDTNSRLGKILRIKVDYTAGAATAFSPAPGNPFIGGGGDPYVFALGLRNPFRSSFAPDGKLVIADVGEGAYEEINLMPTNQPKMNFGWPFMEGDKVNRANPPADLINPVSYYAHTGAADFIGNSLTGGVVYRGPVAMLKDQYLFADFGSNNIWSVPYGSLVQGTILPSSQYTLRKTDFTPDKGAIRSIVCFGEDTAGNVYIVDLGGAIYAILPK